MSLFNTSNLTCTECKTIFPMEVVASINADRRPDLREAIMTSRFQDAVCPECGHTARMQPQFSYMDVERGQWLACMPADEIGTYRKGEEDAKRLFATIFGDNAPEESREVGESLTPRITFGWPAVREKLLIRNLNLDDVVVEEMKMDLTRRLQSVIVAPGVEMRLTSLDGDQMRFQFVAAANEAVSGEFAVDRELYDAIASDQEGWGEIRAMLTDGYFVDMQKALLPG